MYAPVHAWKGQVDSGAWSTQVYLCLRKRSLAVVHGGWQHVDRKLNQGWWGEICLSVVLIITRKSTIARWIIVDFWWWSHRSQIDFPPPSSPSTLTQFSVDMLPAIFVQTHPWPLLRDKLFLRRGYTLIDPPPRHGRCWHQSAWIFWHFDAGSIKMPETCCQHAKVHYCPVNDRGFLCMMIITADQLIFPPTNPDSVFRQHATSHHAPLQGLLHLCTDTSLATPQHNLSLRQRYRIAGISAGAKFRGIACLKNKISRFKFSHLLYTCSEYWRWML